MPYGIRPTRAFRPGLHSAAYYSPHFTLRSSARPAWKYLAASGREFQRQNVGRSERPVIAMDASRWILPWLNSRAERARYFRSPAAPAAAEFRPGRKARLGRIPYGVDEPRERRQKLMGNNDR